MNIRRFFYASILVFIVYEMINFIVHSLILSEQYEALADVWREDMSGTLWIITLTTFIFSFLFVYVYIQGMKIGNWREGLRYGLIMGIMMNSIGMYNQYAVYPIPFSLVNQWFIYGTAQFILCGIVAGAVYKPRSEPMES